MPHTPETGGQNQINPANDPGDFLAPGIFGGPNDSADPLGNNFNTQQLMDFIFGKSPSAQFENLSLATPEQSKALKDLLAFLTSAGQPEGFGGDLVAGLSDLENTSLAALEENALSRGAGGTPTQQLATTTLEGILTAEPTDFQDFFKSSVQDPALKTFEEEILPGIGAKNAKNFFSSERLTQEDRAREDLQQNLNSERGKFAFATNESNQNRKLQALGLVDEITGAPIDQAIKLLEAGQVPRQIEQAGLTAEYGEFLRVQEEKARRIEQILSALNVEQRENIGVGVGGSSGLISDFLGGGGGAGIGAAIFSSRDFKEDIELLEDDEILASIENIGLHRWRYKGDSTTHMGPMAEDFQETFKVGDGKTIHLADVIGITLASNKALAKKLDALLDAA